MNSKHSKKFKLTELQDYFLAIIAGFLGSLAFAPTNQSYLIFITTGLLYHFLYDRHHQAIKAWVLLASLNFSTIWWIHVSMVDYSGVPVVVAIFVLLAFAFYLSSYHALVIYLINKIFRGQMFIKNILALPAGFVLADYAVGHVLTGFPWVYLGYSQVDTFFSNLAPVTGVHGITLAILIITGLFYHSFRSRRLWYFAASLVMLIAIFLMEHDYTKEEDPIKVAIVQGNIPQQIKWDPAKAESIFETYYSLSRDYFKGNKLIDILVWPESALPELENNIMDLIFSLDTLAHSNNFAFITGMQTCHLPAMNYYNSVLGVGVQKPGEDIIYQPFKDNRYYKRHLVPFGEKIPDFMKALRELHPFFNMPMSSFTNGPDEQSNIMAKGEKIATAICYEVAFPDEMQENIKDDTSLLLSVSNDGWFGTYDPQTEAYFVSNGPHQHAAIAKMRAMEFQKPMIRATNNGLSAVFAADGTIVKQLPFYQKGVMEATVIPRSGSTPFGIYGFNIVFSLIFGMILIAFSHLLVLMMTTSKKKKKLK